MRCPRVWLRKPSTRAAPELRPCPLRGPARSWLTTVRSIPNANRNVDLVRTGSGTLTAKARPGAVKSPRLARREAPRASPKRVPLGFAPFGAPSPPSEGQQSQAGRECAPRQGARMFEPPHPSRHATCAELHSRKLAAESPLPAGARMNPWPCRESQPSPHWGEDGERFAARRVRGIWRRPQRCRLDFAASEAKYGLE